MSDLNIKSTHKPIKTYYTELEKYAQLGEENEGTVRAAFQNLLQHYCHQSDFILLCEKMNKRSDIINDPNRVSERSTIHRQVDWESDNGEFGDSGPCKRTAGVRHSLNQESIKQKHNSVIQSPVMFIFMKINL